MERFTLALMLTVVAFRNLIELSGSEFNFAEGFVLPRSFGWFRGNNVLWTISYVCLELFDVLIRCIYILIPIACVNGNDLGDAG